MPVDPKRVETLFNAARELAPVARPAFLAAECAGDAELRARVAQLLAAHAELGEPGASATGDFAAPVADAPGLPGTATATFNPEHTASLNADQPTGTLDRARGAERAVAAPVS